MTFADALAPHYDDALRFCRSLCAGWGPDEAEDVLHDAMIRAYDRFNQLRDPDAFRPWLFRTIARTHHNARRWRFWRRLVPFDSGAEGGPAIYDRSHADPEARALLRALAALPERDRTTLLLFEVGGFSVDEVAKIVGDRTSSAAKSRLSRTRSRLRDALDSDSRTGTLASSPGRTLEEQVGPLLPPPPGAEPC